MANRDGGICFGKMRGKGSREFSCNGSICKRWRRLRGWSKCRVFNLGFIAEDFYVNWCRLHFET